MTELIDEAQDVTGRGWRDVEMPPRIARLPRDPRREFPVPWFVAWIGDPPQPDFRVIRSNGIVLAVREKRCWVCGGPLGRYLAYVVGPMCAVNRTSAEPPSHRDCAIYSARTCPFLTRPHARRRDAGKPEDAVQPAGIMIERNPGVALVWITHGLKYDIVPTGEPGARPGVLFDLGHPDEVMWFSHGRSAKRAEVEHSIDTGLPILRDMAERQGSGAVAELEKLTAQARELLPA